MEYGHLELRIEELLKEKGISKNRICRELDIPRANFNRYCRNDFQRLDANLICKLCSYFECEIGKLIVYVKAWKPDGFIRIRTGFCHTSNYIKRYWFSDILLLWCEMNRCYQNGNNWNSMRYIKYLNS